VPYAEGSRRTGFVLVPECTFCYDFRPPLLAPSFADPTYGAENLVTEIGCGRKELRDASSVKSGRICTLLFWQIHIFQQYGERLPPVLAGMSG
jgi:hypothetical protein